MSVIREVRCCLEVYNYPGSQKGMLGADVLLAVTAVSCYPVGIRLHLHQSGDSPLESKDLLLRCEQSQVLRCLLKRDYVFNSQTTKHLLLSLLK